MLGVLARLFAEVANDASKNWRLKEMAGCYSPSKEGKKTAKKKEEKKKEYYYSKKEQKG